VAQAILTIQFIGRPTKYWEPLAPLVLRYVPLCFDCCYPKPWDVVPISGVCAKCGSDAGSSRAKKIIRRGLTVR
jgi:hypothetical protein